MRLKTFTLFLLLTLIGTLGFASDQPMTHTISVIAGSTPVDNCPITMVIPGMDAHSASVKPGLSMKLENGDETIPATILKGKDGMELVFIVNGLQPYQFRTYTLTAGEAKSENPVKIMQKEKSLDITIGDKPFTTLLYDVNEKMPRPIFYPVLGPNGAPMTRGFPMEKIEGEREDHPHHQSLYVAHGDVNGKNFWDFGSEMSKRGFQKITNMNACVDGAVCGRIDANVAWNDSQDQKIMDEHRIVTIWGTPDNGRMIDFDITFTASEGDVKFGDTKEGGLLTLRVAKKIREEKRERNDPDGISGGGKIINANGLTSSDAWGKPAPWCDYSGIAGEGKAGLTIMDNPSNPFFPTYYHVRTYGLFTANPFGIHDFVNKSVDGSEILRKGESWRLRYRLFIHAGDVESGKVSESYENYAIGPRVILH